MFIWVESEYTQTESVVFHSLAVVLLSTNLAQAGKRNCTVLVFVMASKLQLYLYRLLQSRAKC